jgi:nucleoside 2-deoxyribosyltransferase
MRYNLTESQKTCAREIVASVKSGKVGESFYATELGARVRLGLGQHWVELDGNVGQILALAGAKLLHLEVTTSTREAFGELRSSTNRLCTLTSLMYTAVESDFKETEIDGTAEQLLTVRTAHTKDTAFIMMWMDPARPELDDVCNAIKEVCASFGIKAVRVDDIQHEEKITDVVLKQIEDSEFLIADLTGERPNVYYEVGYAHALRKRPILYRKEGTGIHFDLSVHNVRGYKNVTHLKELLRKRFEAVFDRTGG